jgi:hypothetical protein
MSRRKLQYRAWYLTTLVACCQLGVVFLLQLPPRALFPSGVLAGNIVPLHRGVKPAWPRHALAHMRDNETRSPQVPDLFRLQLHVVVDVLVCVLFVHILVHGAPCHNFQLTCDVLYVFGTVGGSVRIRD